MRPVVRHALPVLAFTLSVFAAPAHADFGEDGNWERPVFPGCTPIQHGEPEITTTVVMSKVVGSPVQKVTSRQRSKHRVKVTTSTRVKTRTVVRSRAVVMVLGCDMEPPRAYAATRTETKTRTVNVTTTAKAPGASGAKKKALTQALDTATQRSVKSVRALSRSAALDAALKKARRGEAAR